MRNAASFTPDNVAAPFRWRHTTSAQRRTLVAAGLGRMLDAFDIMLYSLVLTTLIREFGMSKGTAGFLTRSPWSLPPWAACSSESSPTVSAAEGC